MGAFHEVFLLTICGAVAAKGEVSFVACHVVPEGLQVSLFLL